MKEGGRRFRRRARAQFSEASEDIEIPGREPQGCASRSGEYLISYLEK